MRRTRFSLQMISLVVALSLLIQVIAPVFAPAVVWAASPAAAAVPEQTTEPQQQPSAAVEYSLLVQAEALRRALEQIEAAADDDAFAAALAQVEQVWHKFSIADTYTRYNLEAGKADMAERHLGTAVERMNTLYDEHAQQMQDITGSYEAFLLIAQGGGARQEAQTAAANLRTLLSDKLALDQGPAPDMELLPNRPSPVEATVGDSPALDPLLNAVSIEAESNTVAMVPDNMAMALAASPPTADNLLSTDDATITPEIEALAADLGYDPVAIYQYVRNNISFEPYYGSRKGSVITLFERSGNDYDTASLLIALLRASGFYARYVQGTVAVDEVSALNWVGNAPDLATAGSILATGGVPVALTPDGYLIKEHVWVEVYDVERTSVDFNFNAAIDIGDIQMVANAIDTTSPIFDRDQDGVVDADDVTAVADRWRQQDVGAEWIPLDASFKQYQFYERVDLAAMTGFSTTQYISDVVNSASLVTSDTLQSLSALPELPSSDLPDRDDNDIEFAELRLQEAVSATVDYINANPNLTNTDLLGGSTIITEVVATLPMTIPLTLVPGEPISKFSEIADSARDKVTIALKSELGATIFSYPTTFPALGNKRVTVSYEAATASDQSIIDSYGGALLTTPPIVDLEPVLRIDGVEVARGGAVRMGTRQTRSLTFTDANGSSGTVENVVAAGDTFAVGLAYGRTSAGAVEASKQRLDDARSALPTTIDGVPDVTDPGNMSEAIIGEMLNLSLQAYFNQLDAYSEMTARGRNVRWWRYLSGGVATQGLVFAYGFGGQATATLGGGMSFDIQQNVVSAFSLDGNARDPIVFLQTSGYFGSALEHSLFENIGRGAVSSIRLLSLALERGIPVYRIDATNRAEVLPRLQLSAGTESAIIDALNQGKTVTVSEREMVINDWVGVGYIVLDPATGAAGYLISGGLAGNVGTTNGGSLWDILTTIGAYAWLALNMGLDLWGVWAGIALLMVPEPTLLTKLAGIALIVANLAALGFDVADLGNLIDGDLSAQQYIGEQIQGLIIEAILKRVGIAAAARILDEIGPTAARQVADQIDNLTDGAVDALRTRGFADADIIRMTERGLDSEAAFRTMDDLADRFGVDDVRRLLDNDYFAGKGALERVAQAALDAPSAPGLNDTIANALSRSDFGYAYELQRAAAHASDGVVEYGRRVDVDFQRITGFDANGNPILGPLDTQPLEGDIVLSGDIFIDAKHGPVGNQDLRIWNQIQKAQAAIDAGIINEFRFEASSSVGQRMRDWAAVNAPDVQFDINLGDGFNN